MNSEPESKRIKGSALTRSTTQRILDIKVELSNVVNESMSWRKLNVKFDDHTKSTNFNFRERDKDVKQHVGFRAALGDMLTPNAMYVEFGAGRGGLSHCIAETLEDRGRFVLIDRRRNIRSRSERFHDFSFIRKHVDIRDISDLGSFIGEGYEDQVCAVVEKRIRIFKLKVQAIERRLGCSEMTTDDSIVKLRAALSEKKLQLDVLERKYETFLPAWDGCGVLAISKHLCGVATDLTLRVLSRSCRTGKYAIQGIAIAMCCHAACIWEDYVAQDWFLSLGFVASDFDVICAIASWAVTGDSFTVSSTPSNEWYDILTPSDRFTMGIQAKKLLNHGRLMYVRDHCGFPEAELVEYVDSETTPENCILLAKSQQYF